MLQQILVNGILVNCGIFFIIYILLYVFLVRHLPFKDGFTIVYAIIALLAVINFALIEWRKEQARENLTNTPADAAILSDSNNVTINGICIKGKVYLKDEYGILHVIIVDKEPLECK